MKIYFIFINFIFLIIFNGCEELEITYPGNNQDLDPKPPEGSLNWAIDYDETSGNGKLKENSASGLTIGSLSATDPNPDDEFTYEIYSQKMNDVPVNYFVINSDSGLSNLELSNGNINFEDLRISSEIGAMCVSRPSNPSGNVITDCEMSKLIELAENHEIPLIIDSAYGQPFPEILFKDVSLPFSKGAIYCFSLSKLGLAGLRTGIVVAEKPILPVSLSAGNRLASAMPMRASADATRR